MLRMADIARKAGVAPSTVSVVLSGRENGVRIGDATRRRVLATAKELGYSPNHLARSMRTGNTQMFGFIAVDLSTENAGLMLGGALAEANRYGYTMKTLLNNEPGTESQSMLRRISELRLMGVIAWHPSPSMLEELHREALRCQYPIVLLDANAPDSPLQQVVSDDEQGVKLAVEHLVQLGHRRIAMITGPLTSHLSFRREAFFRGAMKSHDLTVPLAYLIYSDFHDRAPCEQAALTLLKLPPKKRPTALFCAGDRIAFTVLQVAHGLGLRVPQDLSVVGFANLSFGEFSIPPLTTVEQPFQAMGGAAARHLLVECKEISATDSTKKDLSVGAENMTDILPTRLIVRGSTAAPRKANQVMAAP